MQRREHQRADPAHLAWCQLAGRLARLDEPSHRRETHLARTYQRVGGVGEIPAPGHQVDQCWVVGGEPDIGDRDVFQYGDEFAIVGLGCRCQRVPQAVKPLRDEGFQ
jgi:hypothetical protein